MHPTPSTSASPVAPTPAASTPGAPSLVQVRADVAAASAARETWRCPECRLDVPVAANVCVCLRARPPEQAPAGRAAHPQVFADCVFHFNGIIPRSIPHQSHATEWRMAEAHGARCVADFFHHLGDVTHLIYRPGYERSEKARAALRRGIPCVTVNWVLDCLLQSRRLLADAYRLTTVPAVALPTSNGLVLQHHQHAYFVQHCRGFQLHLPGQDGQDLEGPGKVPVFGDAVNARLPAAVRKAQPPELPAVPPLVEPADACEWPIAPRDPAAAGLLAGVAVCFGGDVPPGAAEAVRAHGGDVVAEPVQATHVLWATSGDKKGAVMVAAIRLLEEALAARGKTNTNIVGADAAGDAAAVARAAGGPARGAPTLASATWVLDQLYTGCRIPCEGPYVATAKLIGTLRKRAGGGAVGKSKHADPAA